MTSSMRPLDPRRHAFRSDLADVRLHGHVKAERFVNATHRVVVVPVADVRDAPRRDAGLQTQWICGASVSVFEEKDGWSWCQSDGDGYVGYVETASLAVRSGPATHTVTAPRTFVFSVPDLKSPTITCHCMGAHLQVAQTETVRGTDYKILAGGGAVFAGHVKPIREWEAEAASRDYVAVAESLLNTPYLWGASSAFGIDCSGLVQLSMAMSGQVVLRDSDMQEATIGVALPLDPNQLRRGDLVFWKGHVGIMKDGETLLHANAHTMMVSEEPLSQAIERIAYLYGKPTAFKRP